MTRNEEPESPAGPGTAGPTSKERLIEATVRVGGRDGWGAVTTRAVAAEAQVNHGLVHYHFGSVERLRRAAVTRALDVLAQDALERLEAGGDDLVAALRALVAMAEEPVGDREPATAFVYEAFLAAPRDAEVRSVLAVAVARLRSDLARWVDASTAGLDHRPDPTAVATVLVAVLDGLYLHRLLDPDLDVAGALPALGALLGQRPRTGAGTRTDLDAPAAWGTRPGLAARTDAEVAR